MKRRSKEEIEKDKQEKLEAKKQREVKKEIKRLADIEAEKRWAEWCELYEYLKRDIMGYSKDLKLPQYMLMRLKGLARGQFLANRNQKPNASYEFKTILYTFKMCKMDIISGLKANMTKFNDEQHKFNYAMVIVEKNINDMVIRLQNAKQSKEKAENITVDNIYHEDAGFKRDRKRINERLNNLW